MQRGGGDKEEHQPPTGAPTRRELGALRPPSPKEPRRNSAIPGAKLCKEKRGDARGPTGGTLVGGGATEVLAPQKS